MKKFILKFLKRHSTRIVDANEHKFRLYPRWLIWYVLFLSYNVLVQGVADVMIEVLGHTPWLSISPTRWEFLFLTGVSVLMGYQVLIGMRRRELDVTRNSFALGILVEFGLVVSDLVHIAQYGNDYTHLIWIRLPFIFLTTINFFILVYISRYLKLFRNRKKEFVLA